jgi:hypothetical protein
MRLTMYDLRVTHFMCARNSLFNMMYITTAMPSITPSNFCNFSIFFSEKKIFFKNHTILGGGTHIRPSPRALDLQLDLCVSVQIINCSLNRDSI